MQHLRATASENLLFLLLSSNLCVLMSPFYNKLFETGFFLVHWLNSYVLNRIIFPLLLKLEILFICLKTILIIIVK